MKLALVCAIGVALTAAAPTPARAAMMMNYDLAGLVLNSRAIVIVDRTPGTPGGKPSHYKVVRAIRGPLANGAELDVDDSLYDTAHIDTRVVAFLSPLPAGGWYPTSAGLRVTVDTKVFRYEQWNNPGGFTRVPQGHDPEDNWRPSPQLDRATFDQALVAAIARVDAVAAALALPDPGKRRAAVLALLPPISATRLRAGFYSDALTQHVASELARLGDLEGALEATRHDHAGLDAWLTRTGTIADLLAIAKNAARPVGLRLAALQAVENHADFFANAAAIGAVIALLADPTPAIRAAAVSVAARSWGWSTSDAKETARARQLARDTHAALAKLFASEKDNTVLAALVAADRDAHLARPAGPPVVARIAGLAVEVECMHPTAKLAGGKLLATGTPAGTPVAVPGSTVSLACGNGSSGGGEVAGHDLAPGRYQVAVEVLVAGKPTTIALGMLVVAASGEITNE